MYGNIKRVITRKWHVIIMCTGCHKIASAETIKIYSSEKNSSKHNVLRGYVFVARSANLCLAVKQIRG